MAVRRRIRGNMVTPRLEALLEQDGRGAVDRLAARLEVLAGLPGFEGLSGIRANAVTELLNNEQVCPDKLLVALCLAWGRVDLYYLLGLRDSPVPPTDVHWPGDDPPQPNERPTPSPEKPE